MRALMMQEPQKVKLANLPVPQIGEDQVLIRNKVCAVCNSTDTKMYLGKHALITYPSVFGHEAAGVVERVGKHVTGLKPGDKVMGGNCPATEEYGSFWGQYSEYGVKKQNEVVKIPENVSLEHAACGVMLSEALNAVRVAEVKAGDCIAIIGMGAVGLSILTMAKHTFPHTIVALDISDEKLELAKTLGADVIINSKDSDCLQKIAQATDGKGIHVLFEAVGSLPTYELAFDILNENGVLIPFGLVEGILELPFRRPYSKQLQMRWVRSAGNRPAENMRLTLRMMEKGLVDPSPLITGMYEMEQFEQAIQAIGGGTQIRVLINI